MKEGREERRKEEWVVDTTDALFIQRMKNA
jgi:hypothetical protein